MKKRVEGPLNEVARAIAKGAIALRSLRKSKLGREVFDALEAVTIAESRLEVARQSRRGEKKIRESLVTARSTYRQLLRRLPPPERCALADYLELREMAFAGLSSVIDGGKIEDSRTSRYRQPR